jgi:hypothetical protein
VTNATNSSASSASDPLPLIAEEPPNSYWTFNESADVSKYENFDHSKFIGRCAKVKFRLAVFVHARDGIFRV